MNQTCEKSRGEVGGLEGVSDQNNVFCKFRGFNSGESKNSLHFHLTVPPSPTPATKTHVLSQLCGFQ